MNLDLKNKNALVGGSSKGLGRAAAIELAALGANVTLMARTEDKLKAVQQELDVSRGQDHDYLVIDNSDSAGLKYKIETLVKLKNIHILVNNTGGPKGGALTEARADDLAQAFHNHIVCNHILVQAVLEGMKADNYGRIINITSTSIREPLANLGVSNTIRNAVSNWAKTLANELGVFGITVNNILPGFTSTERLEEIMIFRAEQASVSVEDMKTKMRATVPLGRFGKPEEIAAAIGFLASPAAAYITGSNITIDGGRTKSL